MIDCVPCPAREQLQAFLLGRISEANAEWVEAHVSQCGSCSEGLPTIQAEDTWVAAVRVAGRMAPAPGVLTDEKLLDALCRLGQCMPASSGGAATHDDSSPEISEAVSRPSESFTEGIGEFCAFMAPPQSPAELGRLGAYRALRIIGIGGMGVVFQAEDYQLQRMVAIKAMKPDLAASDSARRRFLREARAAAAIKHDHIVTIHHVGQEGNVPFLVMEFLSGESLDRRLQQEAALPASEVLRIGREIAAGLEAAHAKGLIHRDIKPANIWLDADRGRTKIVDFGLARAVTEGAQLTKHGAIIGTPAYMAPEQASGGIVDARSDLFGLGCVLYRMSTGISPFLGKDTISTLMAVATEHPPPPRDLNCELPVELSDLIMRLLAKRPEARPHSAGAVKDKLRDIAERVGGSPKTTEMLPPVNGRAGRNWRHRISRWPWIVAAAIGLTTVTLTIVIAVRTNDGVIRIEVNDASAPVEVRVDGQAIDIAGAGEPLHLRAGDHQLQVSGQGFETTSQSFTVRRGENPTLSVKLMPKNGDKGTPESRVDRTRSKADSAGEDHLTQAFAFLGARHYDKAIAEATAVLSVNPKSAAAHYCLGQAYSYSNEGDKAIPHFDKAIQIDPRYAEAYNWRGLTYIWMGDQDRGLADCQKALELDPRYANAYMNKALGHFARGQTRNIRRDFDFGLNDCQNALEIEPNSVIAINLRGWGHFLKGEFDKALADCTKAIELDPNFDQAYDYRGWVCLSQGNYKQAIADYTQALRVVATQTPYEIKAVHYLINRGMAYFGTRDYDRAIVDYSEAIRLNPKDSSAYNHRAAAYAKKGDKLRAEQDYQEAIRLSPQPPLPK